MIVVTGGAGFIGSVLVHHLNREGRDDILVVDRLGTGDKWTNLSGLRFVDYADKGSFIEDLENGLFGDTIDTLIHLGACTSTVEQDADYLMKNNYAYSCRIGHWWASRPRVRFVYASSAATYGDGSAGYDDDPSRLDDLCPLNIYALSKHLFDRYARREGWLEKAAGLKFFNVFGPNEWHKKNMASVVCTAFPEARDRGTISLFASGRHDYRDGEQLRDFVYVKDVVAVIAWFAAHPEAAGLFNVGTGIPRTWNDLAGALFSALGHTGTVTYRPMPESLAGRYQYHTCATLGRLQSTGCPAAFRSLEEAVVDYVSAHLLPGRTAAGVSR